MFPGGADPVLPSADTAAMLFWALLASGQINLRKVDGWQTLATKPIDQLDSRRSLKEYSSCYRRSRHTEFQPLSGRHPIYGTVYLTGDKPIVSTWASRPLGSGNRCMFSAILRKGAESQEGTT